MRHLPYAAALFAALCPAPLLAQSAPDWSATFTQASVAPHVRAGEAALVVTAGDPAGAAVGAAALAALNQAGASLVMDGALLGDLSTLGDDAIVKKASGLPVAAIWIVRVFPGVQPGEQTAVVLIYDRASEKLRYAVQATPGAALPAPPDAANTVSSGVDTRARDSVVGKKDPAKDPDRAPEIVESPEARLRRNMATYEVSRIVVEGEGEAQEARRGPERTLDWGEFYELVGADELASDYRSRRGLRVTTGVVGSVALLLGAYVIIQPSLNDEVCGPMEPVCAARQDSYNLTRIGWGSGLLAAGVAGIALTLWIDDDTATPEQRLTLANEYNERLRLKLDLEPASKPPAEPKPAEPTPAAPAPETTLRLELAPSPGGAALRLRF